MAKTGKTRTKKVKEPLNAATKPQAGLTEARVRKLGLDFVTITDAAAHLGRRYDLPRLLQEHPSLAAAWSRGQFLRNLRQLAATITTVAEAANRLGLSVEDLQSRLTGDIETANIWNQARIDTAIELKSTWLAKAKEGNARAMAQVEIALANEIAHAAMDIHSVPEDRMCEVCGVTSRTLNRWLREEGMPRNAGETTYDLVAVWTWHEGLVRKRCGSAPAEPDRLRDVKAERLELELRRARGELAPLEEVKAGLLARERALLAVLEHVPEELSHALAGQTHQQILPVLQQLRRDVAAAWCREIEQQTTNTKGT